MAEAFAVGKPIEGSDQWAALKQGCRISYESIYRENIQALFDYGMHMHNDRDLVKDCVQELFLHIWNHRGSLGNVRNIRAYLLVGLRRKILDQLSAGKKRLHLPLDSLKERTPQTLPHESSMVAAESADRDNTAVSSALNKLSPRQREIVYLMFYKDHSYEEIAGIMSLNAASVYTLAWKAIKSLRKTLPSR